MPVSNGINNENNIYEFSLMYNSKYDVYSIEIETLNSR